MKLTTKQREQFRQQRESEWIKEMQQDGTAERILDALPVEILRKLGKQYERSAKKDYKRALCCLVLAQARAVKP